MNAKKILRNILIGLVVVITGGGILILLIAANGNKSKNICSGHRITIKEQKLEFVQQEDVMKLVSTVTGGRIKDEPLSAFNLRQLEDLLEQNVWISEAELWFDNKDVLHIRVTARQPVARIITVNGNSFYIDGNMNRLPLSDKLSARMPVFTSFPDKKQLTRKDSALLEDVRDMAMFIGSDPFWMSQVAQVDITSQKYFEMIPVIGNHVIRIGDANNMAEKFRRLYVFYQQVLSKTGFEKYKVIDVQYEGQVVGSR